MTPRLALLRPVALVWLGLGLVSCSATRSRMDVPVTAETVDLSRYIGRWYEIARLPMRFQKANEAAIAEYGTNTDGTISVHNIAIRLDGSQRGIRGYAKVLNPPENTKLTVRFKTWFGPLIPVPKEGNYWILHVDQRYAAAIVGTPNRKYLWLLARTPTIPEPRYEALVAKANQLGPALAPRCRRFSTRVTPWALFWRGNTFRLLRAPNSRSCSRWRKPPSNLWT